MQATVPGFWVMGALFAWAIHWRWLGGLVAGVALALSDLAVRSHVTQANYGNVFLLLIGGPIVGFMCASLAQMADERTAPNRPPPRRRSGPGWPSRPRRRAAGPGAGAAPRGRAGWRRGRPRPAGGEQGSRCGR